MPGPEQGWGYVLARNIRSFHEDANLKVGGELFNPVLDMFILQICNQMGTATKHQ